MEMVTIIALVSFLVVLLFIFLKPAGTRTTQYSHLPSPKKLPIIGHLHLLVQTSFPPRRFRDLAAECGPLMHLQFGQVPFLIISSVETARDVLKTHDVNFANRPPGFAVEVLTNHYTDVGYAPYGEYWRQLRKICTYELLSMKRVRSFKPVRVEENLSMARWLASREGSPADLSERLFTLAYDITTRASLGKKSRWEGTVAPLIRKSTKLASGLEVADFYPSLKFLPLLTGLQFKVHRIYSDVCRTFSRILEEHRAAIAAESTADDGLEDLADVLLKLQHQGDQLQLTDANITSVIMDMFTAGSETSAGAAEWTMSELMKHPTIMKKVQNEMRGVFDKNGCIDEEKFSELTYLRLVIKETLRLHPPLPLLVPRINTERCFINGYEIPSGTRVLINSWALGRDSKYWNEAEKFMPERFEEKPMDYNGNTYEYLPFGSGRRICPGMSFGLANLEFTLVLLLYHFDWELPQGLTPQNLDMTEEFGATVARKNHLFLIPTLKRPLHTPA